MKRFLIPVSLFLAVVLYSCGNSTSNKNGESFEAPISNAVETPVMLDGKPVPTQEDKAKAAEEAKDAIDTEAPSDSKGVGKFVDFELKGASVDGAMAQKGEEIFQNSCTACHTTTDKKLVGPGLKNITKIRTAAWIMNMIHDPISMTKDDPVAAQLKKEMNGMQMTPMGLEDDQIRDVLEFLRKNDA